MSRAPRRRRAIDGERRTDAVADVCTESGIRRVDAAETWAAAADGSYRAPLALGDGVALAPAARVDGTLLVGTDDVSDVSNTRFRTDPASDGRPYVDHHSRHPEETTIVRQFQPTGRARE